MAAVGETYDVVVVGLGPCGALCANLLCSRGLKVLAVEQTPSEASARPRAIAMDDDGMRTLAELGLLEAFLADAVPVRGGQFITPEGRFLNGILPREGQGRPGAWTGGSQRLPPSPQGTPVSVFFYQPRLEELLRQRLRSWGALCTVAFSTQLVGYEEREASVTARLRRSRAAWQRLPTGEVAVVEADGGAEEPSWDVQARYLVGCDGSKSSVGRQLNRGMGTSLRLLDLQYDEEWCVLDVMLLDESAIGKDLPYLLVQICDKERKVTYMTGSWVTDRPQRGRHVRWEFEVLPSDDRELVASHDWLRDHFLSRWLVPSQYEIVRSAVYRFHSAIAREWRSAKHGRVFIAGDAAHQNPPFDGQGLTGGFRDATNLCWKLASVLQRPALHGPLLRTYQEERYPHVEAGIQMTIETGKLMQTFCDAKDEDLDALVEANKVRGYGRQMQQRAPAGGLFAPAPRARLAGRPCPQPSVRGRRLDELIGHGFALLLSAAAAGPEPEPEPEPALLAALGGATSLRLAPEELGPPWTAQLLLADWLRKYRAVLVRPDRLVYGAVALGEPPSAVDEMLRQLLGQLGLGPDAAAAAAAPAAVPAARL